MVRFELKLPQVLLDQVDVARSHESRASFTRRALEDATRGVAASIAQVDPVLKQRKDPAIEQQIVEAEIRHLEGQPEIHPPQCDCAACL